MMKRTIHEKKNLEKSNCDFNKAYFVEVFERLFRVIQQVIVVYFTDRFLEM